MEARSIGIAVNILVITGYAFAAAWRGYGRRREHWTRASWIGLGVTVLVGISLIAASLMFSAAVDNHEAWVGAPHSKTRGGWIVVMLGSMLGGVLLAFGTLGWFARGEPTRQFPFFGSRANRRSAPSSLDPSEALTSADNRS